MDFSKLNKRIEFIKLEEKNDEDGYPVNSEKVIKRCWARVRGLRGKEFYQAQQVNSQNNKVFNCRYFEGLTEDIYIKYKGILYNIKSKNNLNEENEEYEIYASEVKASE